MEGRMAEEDRGKPELGDTGSQAQAFHVLTLASPESWAPSHEWDSSCPTCFLIICLPIPKMNSKESTHPRDGEGAGGAVAHGSAEASGCHKELSIARTAVGAAAADSLEPPPAAGAQYSPLLPQPGAGELTAGRLKTPSSLHLEGNPWFSETAAVHCANVPVRGDTWNPSSPILVLSIL